MIIRLTQRADESTRSSAQHALRGIHMTLKQQLEAAGFEQDSDVLDTWFSICLVAR